jgi:hypothetical protein
MHWELFLFGSLADSWQVFYLAKGVRF